MQPRRVRQQLLRRAWEATALKYTLPSYEAIPAKGCTYRELADILGRRDGAIEADRSLQNKFYQMFPGLGPSSALEFGHVLTDRRMTIAAIAVLRQRLKAGSLPRVLPALGENGTDPFNGKPLGYKITADGFKVYSVDNDLIDDGGLSRREDIHGKSKTHDIVRAITVR